MIRKAKKGSLREHFGISQAELAVLYGVSRPMVAMMEKHDKSLGLKKMRIEIYLLKQIAAIRSNKLKVLENDTIWESGPVTEKKIRKRLSDSQYFLEKTKRQLQKLNKEYSTLSRSYRAIQSMSEEGLDDPKAREKFLLWKSVLVDSRRIKLKKYKFEVQLNLQLKIARFASEVKVLSTILENFEKA